MKTEIGLIGLGVMGKSLSRNLAQKGYNVSMFNRHVDGKEEHVAIDFKNTYPELKHALPFDDLGAFVQSLKTPRKILLMVNAGPAVDAVLSGLVEYLEKGDIVIDGGNSHFEDTNRRIIEWEKLGLNFLGAGISGGEEGALLGPSIMPSGSYEAFLKVQKYLESIVAKDANGNPCCTYVGSEGSGHFVKMIHNGIEYVEMQLLAECYFILKNQGLSNTEIADILESWENDLGSYLLEITIAILRKKKGKEYVLDCILDKAGNKGTGDWATVSIASSGVPASLIPAALLARYLSFFKEKRVHVSKEFPANEAPNNISIQDLKKAYQFARIINHDQGLSLINHVSEQNGWHVDLSEIARIWTGGCIIKSAFMQELVSLLKSDKNLIMNSTLIPVLKHTHPSIQRIAIACIEGEVYAPCMIEAVNYFHGLKTQKTSANLIQAQRDYFGAHTYQRIDDPTGKSYHTRW